MKPKIRFSSSNILYEEKTLSEISTINPKTNVPLEFEYVDLESVSGTEMTNHRTEHKATAPSRAQRLAKKGDIFYQTVRPYQKNNYYFDMDDDNYVFSTGYAQIRPSIYGKYLFTLLQNDSFLKQVLDNCAGTSFPAINPSVLSRLSVRICKDKQEQQAIASYFTSLDSQISASTSRLASLKQMKAASLQAMFPQEGETVPKIRFKGFEGEWKKVSFKDFTFHAGTKNRDNLPLESYSISNEFGFIPQNEQFENGGTMTQADKRMYYIVSSNSFAYNPARINVGSLGYYEGNEDVIVSSLYEVFKTDDTICDRFLLYWFKPNIFQKMIEQFQEGGVRLYFFYDKMCKCSLMRPSLAEQQAIASYFTSLDRQISLQSQRLEKLKQIKSACLDKMFV